jgi:tRNA(Ile)-lysidine synthase
MGQVAGKGVVQRFLTFLRSHELTGRSIGVAFSGGPDSTALALVAAEAARARLIHPVAIHVDHGVRVDSSADLTTIRDTCQRLDLELKSVRADLPPDASEDEMRIQRYRLLAGAIAEAGGHHVMTAHHAGDQAETVLLHVIRGSGLEGVAGMAPIERLPTIDAAVHPVVVRPFLREARASLLELVGASGLPYLIDPTNADRDKSRNAIRHDVLPVLEEIHAGAGEAIARLAEIARDDHEALQNAAGNAVEQHVVDGRLSVTGIRSEPVAIQRRVIREWVKSRTGVDLTWNRTEAIREATQVDRGGTIVEVGESWVARRTGKVVRLSRSDEG